MRKIILLLLLCGIVFLIPGCLTTSEFDYIENAIRKEIRPARIHTDFKFSFGPASLATIRGAAGLCSEGRKAAKILAEISNVQVGVYKIENYKKTDKFQIPLNVEEKLYKSGWESFVRVKDKDEHVNLLYKELKSHVCSLYIISLERDELVIVEVCGRLEKIIEQAIKEHGLKYTDHLDISL